MEGSWSEMELPGFRFHPTEEELLDFYLKWAVHGKKHQPEVIRTLNLYRHDPWELPGMARCGEREWYFFVPRDRRSNNGGRPNRTTAQGFWKATGSDRQNRSISDPSRLLGYKKTMVFYEGRAPRGTRTDWVMNEYQLPNTDATSSPPPPKLQEDIVLCKIYRKAMLMKELERRAAIDKDAGDAQCSTSMAVDNTSSSFSASFDQETSMHMPPTLPVLVETDAGTMEMKVEMETEKEAQVTSVPVGSENCGKRILPELEMLQVPPKYGFDWTQEPFFTVLHIPRPDNWSSYCAKPPKFLEDSKAFCENLFTWTC